MEFYSCEVLEYWLQKAAFSSDSSALTSGMFSSLVFAYGGFI